MPGGTTYFCPSKPRSPPPPPVPRSCPFDFVRLYDGANKSAPLIGTFCRPERNLVKYSTGHNLLMTFVTIKRTPNPEKRGFSGIFEFSESFVNLGQCSAGVGVGVGGEGDGGWRVE